MASINNSITASNKGASKASEKLKTLIVVILDESGSMQIQQHDVIGGYNNFLKQQRELPDDKARLLFLKFNTDVKVGHAAIDIEATPQLNHLNYIPSGGTALYDAVADGIRIGEGAIQSDERVIVLIMTDGEENSSRRYGSGDVKRLIASHEALGNWSFVYIGANPERWSREMGQHFSNACGYDMHVQANNFATVSAVTSEFRVQQMPQQQQGLMLNQPQFQQQQQMPRYPHMLPPSRMRMPQQQQISQQQMQPRQQQIPQQQMPPQQQQIPQQQQMPPQQQQMPQQQMPPHQQQMPPQQQQMPPHQQQMPPQQKQQMPGPGGFQPRMMPPSQIMRMHCPQMAPNSQMSPQLQAPQQQNGGAEPQKV